MKFITIRDLRQSTKKLKSLMKKNRRIVLTSNGKPIALITPVNEKTLEDQIDFQRRMEAKRALDQVRREAKEKGLDKLSMKEIDDIIAEVRRERRAAGTGK
jgi:antitoxin (DNA-binding transcriptional repressor) of toxin-antitoxin stability system